MPPDRTPHYDHIMSDRFDQNSLLEQVLTYGKPLCDKYKRKNTSNNADFHRKVLMGSHMTLLGSYKGVNILNDERVILGASLILVSS